MSPLQANVEKLCWKESTVEVSKYFAGSKIKEVLMGGCFFLHLPFLQFLCLNSAKTYLPPPIFHIENTWVLRVGE